MPEYQVTWRELRVVAARSAHSDMSVVGGCIPHGLFDEGRRRPLLLRGFRGIGGTGPPEPWTHALVFLSYGGPSQSRIKVQFFSSSQDTRTREKKPCSTSGSNCTLYLICLSPPKWTVVRTSSWQTATWDDILGLIIIDFYTYGKRLVQIFT
jgi:hypothetical protein